MSVALFVLIDFDLSLKKKSNLEWISLNSELYLDSKSWKDDLNKELNLGFDAIWEEYNFFRMKITSCSIWERNWFFWRIKMSWSFSKYWSFIISFIFLINSSWFEISFSNKIYFSFSSSNSIFYFWNIYLIFNRTNLIR